VRKKYSQLFKDSLAGQDAQNLNSLEKYMKLELERLKEKQERKEPSNKQLKKQAT